MWSTGRFTDRNKYQGEICKSFLTVNMIQGSDLLPEVPLKKKKQKKRKRVNTSEGMLLQHFSLSSHHQNHIGDFLA